jgi:hypothetical protein
MAGAEDRKHVLRFRRAYAPDAGRRQLRKRIRNLCRPASANSSRTRTRLAPAQTEPNAPRSSIASARKSVRSRSHT